MTPAEIQNEFDIYWAETGMDREPDNDYDEEYYKWQIKNNIETHTWNSTHPAQFIIFLEKNNIQHIWYNRMIAANIQGQETLIKDGDHLTKHGNHIYHTTKDHT